METELDTLAKNIYAKLDSIQAVLGYILEKTKQIPEPQEVYIPPHNPAIDNLENKIIE